MRRVERLLLLKSWFDKQKTFTRRWNGGKQKQVLHITYKTGETFLLVMQWDTMINRQNKHRHTVRHLLLMFSPGSETHTFGPTVHNRPVSATHFLAISCLLCSHIPSLHGRNTVGPAGPVTGAETSKTYVRFTSSTFCAKCTQGCVEAAIGQQTEGAGPK